MTERPPITPHLTVGELLEQYPELEETLIGLSPAFKKLRNPVLRRTIAKLTSLQQAAQVAGVSIGEMIGTLRTAAGCQAPWDDGEGADAAPDERPAAFEDVEPIETFDAVEEIEAGGHPLPKVMASVQRLQAGEIYSIITPFVPAPMLDKMRAAGFEVWTQQLGRERFQNFFGRLPEK